MSISEATLAALRTISKLAAENERLRQEIQALRAQQEAQAAYSLMEEEGEMPR